MRDNIESYIKGTVLIEKLKGYSNLLGKKTKRTLKPRKLFTFIIYYIFSSSKYDIIGSVEYCAQIIELEFKFP